MIAIKTAGHGEPLVLLHGVGANRGIWRDVVHQLAVDRLVLAPDLPGFGDSSPVGAGFTLDGTANALADELSQRVPGRFDLVGNSLGGAVALALALARPDLVRRLVLVAPAGFSPRPRLVSAVVGRLSEPLISFRRRLGTPLIASATARRVLLWGTVSAPQHLAPQDARAMLQASRRSSRVGPAVAAVLGSDLRDELTRVEAPLGLIWGARDRVVPITTIESIRAVRPGVVVEVIADAAHVPQLERPVEFVAALRRVLDQL